MNKSHSPTKFLVQYRDNVTSRAGKFRLETNNFYEVYTYIYGEGPYFYFVNDRIYSLEPGCVLLLRPGVLVGGCKKIEARYTRLVCKMPVYMVELLESVSPALGAFLSDSDVSILRLEGEVQKEYYSYVEELAKLSKKNGRHTGALMLSVLIKMLVLLSRLQSPEQTERAAGGTDGLIGRIISEINSEYAEISTVEELARRMNYSKNYLSQYFKSRMNMGLHDFLIMKKLSVAAAKLISGKSVTEAAFECGFGSTAYFISLFKAHYGTTPGKYMSENS